MRGLNKGLLAGGRLLRPKHVFVQRRFLSNPTLGKPSREKHLENHVEKHTETHPENSSANVPKTVPKHAQKTVPTSSTILPSLSTPSSVNHGPSTASEHSAQKRNLRPRMAYIAIGSNIGNRIVWIEKAIAQMKLSEKGIVVKRTSSLWETEPMYVTDQEKFLNGVIEVETVLDPETLLRRLQQIENDLGRMKVQEKGPRNIDLDILLYEGEKVDTKDLIIPHLLMLEREFVLRPLSELIPTMEIDPSQPGRTTKYFLDSLPPSSPPMLSVFYLNTNLKHTQIKPLDPKRRTHIMGIANLTPDSFSDGGKYSLPTISIASEGAPVDKTTTTAKPGLKALGSFIQSFAPSTNPTAIIDIGGQSSAPGAPEVTAEEETARVLETVQYVQQRSKQVAISIDTYRASVAEAAVMAGAHIVNDISAGQMDPEMLSTVARLGVTIVLMHMRGTPQTMNGLTDYEPLGLIPTIAKELLERVAEAEAAGIYRWRIILDPGVGFAKTAEQNLEILRRLDELRNWPGLKGYPWLVGSSRKNFIGTVTGVRRPDHRITGSIVAAAAAIQGGADIVRVHDASAMVKAGKMADAIWRA